MSLYPLKFNPRFVEKIWGGRKLQTVLGKNIPEGKLIGESWELYDFPPGVVESSSQWISSPIANGSLAGRTLHDAVLEWGRDLLGDVPLAGRDGQFPILIKFLDAREDLSVQVHPDEAFARANPQAHLKTEAWYVVQHDPQSRLLKGLRRGVRRADLEQAAQQGDVERHIVALPAREGDCHYLPSGTVHALGAGMLVAEVQTPSDTTFRVFDFNRIDPATGKPRALHVEQALQCIQFSIDPQTDTTSDLPSRLVTSRYFHLDEFVAAEAAERALELNGPVVWIVLEGAVQIQSPGGEAVHAARGEVVLLPAMLRLPRARTSISCKLLQVTFPSAG